MKERLELDALGDAPSSVEADVAAHLAGCPRCREAGEDVQATMAAVRSSIGSAGPRPAFLRGLREAVSTEVRAARRRRTVRWTFAAAAAASVLAVAGWHLATRHASRAQTCEAVERWRHEGALAEREVAAGTMTAGASHTYFVRRGSAGSRVVAVDVATGRTCWETPVDTIGRLASDASRVYCLARRPDAVELVALDASRGDELWRYAAGRSVSFRSPSRPLPLAGDRVCWSVGDGVHVLEAGTGGAIWTRRFEGEGRLSAVEADAGRLYVASGRALHCFEGKTGNERWSRPLGDGIARGAAPMLAVGGGRAYVVSAMRRQERRLTCANLRDGRMLWSRTVPRPHHLLAADEGVYVRAAEVLAFDGVSGAPRWSHAAGGCGPLTTDDQSVHLVDSSGEGKLLALERRTGREAWEIPGIRSCDALVLAGGLGIVGTTDGVLRAFSIEAH